MDILNYKFIYLNYLQCGFPPTASDFSLVPLLEQVSLTLTVSKVLCGLISTILLVQLLLLALLKSKGASRSVQFEIS